MIVASSRSIVVYHIIICTHPAGAAQTIGQHFKDSKFLITNKCYQSIDSPPPNVFVNKQTNNRPFPLTLPHTTNSLQALSNAEVTNTAGGEANNQQQQQDFKTGSGLGNYLDPQQANLGGQLLGSGTSSASKQRQLLSGTKLVTMGDSQDKGPTSLFIFEENNFIRLKTRAIIENSVFEWTVLATIIANCVALAMEAHLPNNDKTELAIQIVSITYSFLPPLARSVELIQCNGSTNSLPKYHLLRVCPCGLPMLVTNSLTFIRKRPSSIFCAYFAPKPFSRYLRLALCCIRAPTCAMFGT